MPSTILDSAVFRDIFTTEAMRQVWSDENRVQKYLDIEAALARAQGKLGIIPKEAAAEIVKHCDAKLIDMGKLKAATERIGYPVLPVVQQLVKLCKDGLGEWCHWGATTQDITDTATVMQIAEALDILEKELDAYLPTRSPRWRRNTATRRWPAAAICSRRCRSPSATRWRPCSRPSSGTRNASNSSSPACWSANSAAPPARLSSLGKDGLKVQAELMKELKLGQPAISWHTVRDCIAEVGCFLGLVTGSCGKIAFDVKLLDADRSGRGLRAVPRRPRLVLAPCRRSATRSHRSTSPRRPRW